MRAAPLLLALTTVARVAAAAPATPRIASETFQLANGLTVILHEDHRVPLVSLNLRYRVGSADERPGRSGFAHLFEHLMFMGTRAVPRGQLDHLIEAAGGQNNAATSEDCTSYYATGPARLLDTLLYLEADRMASLGDDITQDALDLQRGVVLAERSQSFDNHPYAKVDLVLPERIFPPGHPYHHPVIGSVAALAAATLSDVKAFFREFYLPANAQLVIAGDFAPADARRRVERWFGAMPRRTPPLRAEPIAIPPLDRSQTVTLPEPVELSQVTLAFPSPAEFAPGDAECELLAALLGMGDSSRLQHALVHERKIAESVTVEQRSGRLGGDLVITALAQQGHGAAELARALDAELDTLATRPPSAAELRRARAQVRTDRLRDLEHAQAVAEELNAFADRFGDAGALERDLATRYRDVTPADLSRWARQVIVNRPHVTVRVVPAARKPPAR